MCLYASPLPIRTDSVQRGTGGVIHIGVGSDVVCPTTMGNARASIRGTDNSDESTLFCVGHRTTAQERSDMSTLSNVETRRGEAKPQSVTLAPDTIPEAVSLRTGESVRYAHHPAKRWYVFRASYGREDIASDHILSDGTFVYIAKRFAYKTVNGKRKKVLESLIPNLLFVYTTKDQAEAYVKHTPALSFLTYYYNHFVIDAQGKNPPLIISCREMENFILATCNHSEHLRFVDKSQCHFKGGETVRVTHGLFKGVEGKVARVSGQQRVIISLSTVALVSTAYIPTAFLTPIND